MNSDREIGFISGVAYAAALMKGYKVSAEQLLKESGISKEDLLKYADKHDLVILGLDENK